MKITLVLEAETPSNNTYSRDHWAKRSADKERWGFLIVKAVGNSENMARYKAKGPRALTITRFGKRQCDLDNIAGGAKGVIDALRKHGLLLDDDPKSMVALTVVNGKLKPKEAPHTLVFLEDVEA